MLSDLLYEWAPLMGHYIDFPHLGPREIKSGTLGLSHTVDQGVARQLQRVTLEWSAAS